MRGKVICHALNVRKGPSINFQSIGYLQQNEIVEWDLEEGGFVHIISVSNPAKRGFIGNWAARVYNGAILISTIANVQLARVKHDIELFRMSRPDRVRAPKSVVSLPATVKLRNSRFIGLSKSWQFFWYDLLKQSTPNLSEQRLKRAWSSLIKGYRAFTNKHGPDNGYWDAITGENEGADPIAVEPIITTGNVVRILDGPVTLNGEVYYKIETCNLLKPPPNISRNTHPWLIQCATESYRDGRVLPFQQLGGADVYVPLFSDNDYNYIAADWVEFVDNVPSPYRR